MNADLFIAGVLAIMDSVDQWGEDEEEQHHPNKLKPCHKFKL
jgi:hypothetical protein